MNRQRRKVNFNIGVSSISNEDGLNNKLIAFNYQGRRHYFPRHPKESCWKSFEDSFGFFSTTSLPDLYPTPNLLSLLHHRLIFPNHARLGIISAGQWLRNQASLNSFLVIFHLVTSKMCPWGKIYTQLTCPDTFPFDFYESLLIGRFWSYLASNNRILISTFSWELGNKIAVAWHSSFLRFLLIEYIQRLWSKGLSLGEMVTPSMTRLVYTEGSSVRDEHAVWRSDCFSDDWGWSWVPEGIAPGVTCSSLCGLCKCESHTWGPLIATTVGSRAHTETACQLWKNDIVHVSELCFEKPSVESFQERFQLFISRAIRILIFRTSNPITRASNLLLKESWQKQCVWSRVHTASPWYLMKREVSTIQIPPGCEHLLKLDT